MVLLGMLTSSGIVLAVVLPIVNACSTKKDGKDIKNLLQNQI